MQAPHTIVLGTAQDGGFPHVGCRRGCCRDAWDDPSRHRRISCLGIVDPESQQRWLIDCTPDFPRQLHAVCQAFHSDANEGSRLESPTFGIDGLLLTHAHIGHYTGLMSLGREGMNVTGVPVFAMPRMRLYLQSNEPWRQLINNGNIAIQSLEHETAVRLNQRISVSPFQVTHRSEFSETVGFRVAGPNRSVLWLPDIDAWDDPLFDVKSAITSVEVAYLDGTFFSAEELPGRDLEQIPHPRISDSLQRFGLLSSEHREKIRFVHFNHSNPVLQAESEAAKQVVLQGMRMAAESETNAL